MSKVYLNICAIGAVTLLLTQGWLPRFGIILGCAGLAVVGIGLLWQYWPRKPLPQTEKGFGYSEQMNFLDRAECEFKEMAYKVHEEEPTIKVKGATDINVVGATDPCVDDDDHAGTKSSGGVKVRR